MGNYDKNTEHTISFADAVRLAPVIFFVSVIFLLVGLHIYTMPVSQFPYLSGGDNTPMFDTMAYVKMVAIIATSCVAAALFAYYVITGKRTVRRTRIYFPILVYALSIVISYAFSDYKQFALWGTFDRFEGTLVHLCYLFMMFYAINCVDGEKELKIIVDTLFAGVTIACLIGLTQFLGHDFFSDGLGKMIVLGRYAGELDLHVGDGGVYQTVYNMNYVAFYLCLVTPILICRIIDMLSEKNFTPGRIAYTAWLFALLILTGVNIVGASSVGSVPGLAFSVISIVIFRLSKIHSIRKVAVVLAAYAAVAILASTGAFGVRFSPFIHTSSDIPPFDILSMHDNMVEISVNGNTIIAEYGEEEGGFSVRNEAGQEYTLFTDPDEEYRYGFDNDALRDIVAFTPFMQEGRVFAEFDINGERFAFEFTPQGPVYINASGKPETIANAEHAGVFKNYSFGSGRGYIWDTALPLIRHFVVCGAGADTFMFVFPHNDYITRYNNGLWTGALYDKPHNMYIQIAISFGLIALLSFIGIMVSSFVDVIKCFKSGEITSLTVSVFVGIIAFLMSSLVNDSSVSVMPMFYGLLGTAVACCANPTPDKQ